MDKPAVRDAALLLLRIVLGTVFVAHGWDKLMITGLTETTGQFSAWGVPQPQLTVRLGAGVRAHVGAPGDDPPAEPVAVHVHRGRGQAFSSGSSAGIGASSGA